MGNEDRSAVSDAALAATLFAVDPLGLRGVVLKGHSGPARDAWIANCKSLLDEHVSIRRLPLHIAADRLIGGLDIAATLEAGRPVTERGFLAAADGGLILIGSAERLDRHTVALVGSALDVGAVQVERDGVAERHAARFGVIACDESAADEDGLCAALLDRLAMVVFADAASGVAPSGCTPGFLADARLRLSCVTIADDLIRALDEAAAQFGVRSLNVLSSALRVAKVHAAFAARREVTEHDLGVAARLVIGPRAVMLPPDVADDRQDTPTDNEQTNQSPSQSSMGQVEDLIVASAKSAIPLDLLASLGGQATSKRSRAEGRSGQEAKAAQRGRPAGVRAASVRRGARLSVIDTLRAAAPWQRLRRSPDEMTSRVVIRPDDFRIVRFKHKTETATIFVVDASGSTAIARLAEAKGALELLLGSCYVRRDHVALIAFGGKGARLLLPPTRSLTRVKRDLADLPGGGGTPLASGISAAVALASKIRRKGQTPSIVLLTDGRANLALDGRAERGRAASDALAAAKVMKASHFPGILIDLSDRRTNEAAAQVAAAMGARYLPLPHGDAHALSQAVRWHARETVP